MRITHVPYTKKRLTTLDLVQTDEVLYRDEEWLARDKDITGLNTRYLFKFYKRLQKMYCLSPLQCCDWRHSGDSRGGLHIRLRL